MPRIYTFSSMNSLFGPVPSKIMQDILEVIRSIAVSDLGILLVGEDGTEKIWLANLIHEFSERINEKIVTIDCSILDKNQAELLLFGSEEIVIDGVRITKGAIEENSRGTLVLENLCSLPLHLQEKLAKILEHRHFRRVGGFTEIETYVRIISTVNKRSSDPTGVGSLDRETSYHLCPVIINLPPLRERRDDIPFLIEKFIVETSDAATQRFRGITSGALNRCLTYDWPGNTRELKEVVRHALMNASDMFIRTTDLPKYLRERSKAIKKSAISENLTI